MEKFLIKKNNTGDSNKPNTILEAQPGTSKVSETITKPLDKRPISIEESNDDADEPIKKKKMYPQKFRTVWQDTYKWLTTKNGKQMCNICDSYVSGGGFHLKRHEKSMVHLKKLNVLKFTPKMKNFIPTDTSQSLCRSVKNAEIKWCGFLCEKNLPLDLIGDLVDFCANIYHDSLIAKSIKIKRNKATLLINTNLGPSCEEKVLNDLKNNYFSLIIDESTTISMKKHLAILARYWKDDRVEEDVFVKLLEVKDGTSEALCQSIKSLLDMNNIPYNNVIGFGADNASVMMGQFNGVQARLKQFCPNIVIQSCSCHSLHLCASAAANKLPSQVEQFVRDLHGYFAHSTKRFDELRECQVFCNENPHQIPCPSQTRWLSREQVVRRILEHWSSLTLFFQRAALEDHLPVAISLLEGLKNPIFKLYLLFLSHVLKIIIQCNLEFQSKSAKVPLLLEIIVRMYTLYLKAFIKPEILNNYEPKDISINNSRNYLDLNLIYCGPEVHLLLNDPKFHIQGTDLHQFKLRCLDFYIEMCKQIKKRFDFNNKYLIFASNFTPKTAVTGIKLSLAEAQSLFPNIKFNLSDIDTEWQNLSIIAEFKKYESLSISEFWSIVNKSKTINNEQMFKNLMVLVKIILALPHSSAAAERIFSQQNLIINKIRNSMSVNTCSNILHIKQDVSYAGSTKDWNVEQIFKKKIQSINILKESDSE